MDSKNVVKSNGLGFGGALQIVFIVLKLCHVISWSWFWVLFPSILTTDILVIALLILAIIAICQN